VDLTCWSKLIQVNPIYCYLNIKKNIILNFFSNYIFTGYPSCFYSLKVNWVTSSQLPHNLFIFPQEKKLATFEHFFYIQEKFDQNLVETQPPINPKNRLELTLKSSTSSSTSFGSHSIYSRRLNFWALNILKRNLTRPPV